MWSDWVVMPRAGVVPQVSRNPLAAVEHLDGAGGGAGIDLLSEQRVRHRVAETRDLDMIVHSDAGEAPFGVLVILLRQGLHGGTLDGFEELPTADTQAAHLAAIHPLDGHGYRGIAFSQREEREMPQTAQNVALREAYSGLNRGLVLGLSRSRGQYADAVVRRHRAVGAVQLRIVERRLGDAALEVVRHQQSRHRPVEPEHPDMRANPVRQALRPARLGIGQVRRAEHADEDLRQAHLSGERVDDRHLLAGGIHEGLVPGEMALPHGRRQAPVEFPEQLAESAVAVPLWMNRRVFLPEDRQADPGTLQLTRQRAPVRLGVAPGT